MLKRLWWPTRTTTVDPRFLALSTGLSKPRTEELSTAIGFSTMVVILWSMSKMPIGTWVWFGVATIAALIVTDLFLRASMSSSEVVKIGILCFLASSDPVGDCEASTIAVRIVEGSSRIWSTWRTPMRPAAPITTYIKFTIRLKCKINKITIVTVYHSNGGVICHFVKWYWHKQGCFSKL